MYTYEHTLAHQDVLPICGRRSSILEDAGRAAAGDVLSHSNRHGGGASALGAERIFARGRVSRGSYPATHAGGASKPPHLGTPCEWTQSSLHRRSEEHTSELQSLIRISYAIFYLKK